MRKLPIIGLLVTIYTIGVFAQKSLPLIPYFASEGLIKYEAGFFDSIYLLEDASQFLDNYIDDVHVHLETTGGYDQPQPYVNSFTGASYKWSQYYYNGIRMDHPLQAGDALYHPTLANRSFSIDRIKGRISWSEPHLSGTQYKLSMTHGGVGPRVRFADWFINNISGHNSARQRQEFPITKRTEIPFMVNFSLTNNLLKDSLHYPVEFNMHTGLRTHLDQDYTGNHMPYDEDFTDIFAAATLSHNKHFLGQGWKTLFRYQHRSHFFSEFQYSREETASLKAVNFSLYTNGTKQNNGIHLAWRTLHKDATSFTRNLIDQDGEGLEPYYQDGRQWSITHYLRQGNTWKKHKAGYSLEMYNSLLGHSPEIKSFDTNLYAQSLSDNYSSLHYVQWKARPFISVLLDDAFMVWYGTDENMHHSWRLSGGIHLSGMLLQDESLLDWSPELDLKWQQQWAKKWNIGLRIGWRAHPFDVTQIRYLSSDYLEGEVFYWSDSNNNYSVDDDETSSLAYGIGGKYREVKPGLGMASTIYLDLPITYFFKDDFQIGLVPQYRQFRNTWSTSYMGGIEEQGILLPFGEREIWFPNPQQDRRYLVEPYPEKRMQSRSGESKSFLFNQPFYVGATFRLQKESPRWFISLSFTANMVVGASGLGNGPLHNNIMALSDTWASPNLIEHQVGRLDSDRSFISRFFLSHRYHHNGSIVLHVKYRDGQSFANYEPYIRDIPQGRQIAFYQHDVRGDDPFISRMGRREDFFTNVELRWQHQFSNWKAGIQISNLLDFANETSEYTFGYLGDYNRAPLELQVPRSVKLSFIYCMQ